MQREEVKRSYMIRMHDRTELVSQIIVARFAGSANFLIDVLKIPWY
jgi:hypothetical protein